MNLSPLLIVREVSTHADYDMNSILIKIYGLAKCGYITERIYQTMK
jgi:hypothetical protein